MSKILTIGGRILGIFFWGLVALSFIVMLIMNPTQTLLDVGPFIISVIFAVALFYFPLTRPVSRKTTPTYEYMVVGLLIFSFFLIMINFYEFRDTIFKQKPFPIISLIFAIYTIGVAFSNIYTTKVGLFNLRAYLLILIVLIGLRLSYDIVQENYKIDVDTCFFFLFCTGAIALCIKGLIITYQDSFNQNFPAQKSPFLNILLVTFIFFALIFSWNHQPIHTDNQVVVEQEYPALNQSK